MQSAQLPKVDGEGGGGGGGGGTMQHHARPPHGDFGAGLLVLVQSVLQHMHVLLLANYLQSAHESTIFCVMFVVMCTNHV